MTNTHLTPAEKLTTGKKKPSVLKFSNMPWTGCPLILKEMLGAPRSRQQLTTSSEVRMCWFMDATARGIRPVQTTHTHTVMWNMAQWVMLARITSFTHRNTHRGQICTHSCTQSGQEDRPCRVMILSRHNPAIARGYHPFFYCMSLLWSQLHKQKTDFSSWHWPDQRWSPSKPKE